MAALGRRSLWPIDPHRDVRLLPGTRGHAVVHVERRGVGGAAELGDEVVEHLAGGGQVVQVAHRQQRHPLGHLGIQVPAHVTFPLTVRSCAGVHPARRSVPGGGATA